MEKTNVSITDFSQLTTVTYQAQMLIVYRQYHLTLAEFCYHPGEAETKRV